MTSQAILVVEDDPDGQTVVAHILDYMQYKTHVVGEAESAIVALHNAPQAYRAVVIDLALPGKDGWQLLSEIRGNSNTENLPCIAVTAFHTSKLREDALRAGFNAYFPKPLEATAFVRALESFLGTD